MDLSHVISEISRSGARFAATLTDTELRSPSTLPGWTRGHVAAHVASSADAYVWLLAVARTDADPAPRAGTEALARRRSHCRRSSPGSTQLATATGPGLELSPGHHRSERPAQRSKVPDQGD
ncbi:maleylpyruvate isomerase N-terminal domain-containing protein [Streptomyces spiramyceticus]|uniref:maleylpyruvate isomerase N-terminal domain-containing protein n=1 Tax=Streptomyces spiramyceticus TaxID=299717 RepID=UPI00237A31A0|nr:maleylpyruvate isomerase N-terminal domain-containing protein [Streptomyces spiramyceticus]